jgi:U2 small nuclear ribonucleoprotein A'
MELRAGAGALGPRLAGRLTAELILRSPQYMSCVGDYEIDLRGHKISVIENLGATQNQFDSMDLSDNTIVRLEGFPKLARLKTLLLNNNRITRISRNLEENVPNIQWLVLTNNRLTNLADLDPLATFPKLTHLSLMDNVVTKKPNYRLYVIHKCRKLKQLDFKKVKQKERDAAAAMFGAPAAADGEAQKQTTFEPDEELAQAEAQAAAQQQDAEAEAQAATQKGPTPEQITAIKAAIANATTLEEMRRLEEALATGQMPSQVADPGEAAKAVAESGADANGDSDTAAQGNGVAEDTATPMDQDS